MLSQTTGACTATTYDVGNNVVSVNPLTVTDASGTTTFTYDDTNRMNTQTTASGTTTFSYDAAGNMTVREDAVAGTTTYSWDGDSRLRNVTLPSLAVVTLTYNAEGMLASKITSSGTVNYLWNGQVLQAQTDGTGTFTTQYTQGAGAFGNMLAVRDLAGSTDSYVLPDAQGNASAIADGSGSVTRTTTYDAFGKQIGGTGSGDDAQKYVAKQGYLWHDDLGLQYVRQRWYASDLKRWISEDRTGLMPDLNLYRYMHNMAQQGSDPSGNEDPYDPKRAAAFDQQLASLAQSSIGVEPTVEGQSALKKAQLVGNQVRADVAWGYPVTAKEWKYLSDDEKKAVYKSQAYMMRQDGQRLWEVIRSLDAAAADMESAAQQMLHVPSHDKLFGPPLSYPGAAWELSAQLRSQRDDLLKLYHALMINAIDRDNSASFTELKEIEDWQELIELLPTGNASANYLEGHYIKGTAWLVFDTLTVALPMAKTLTGARAAAGAGTAVGSIVHGTPADVAELFAAAKRGEVAGQIWGKTEGAVYAGRARALPSWRALSFGGPNRIEFVDRAAQLFSPHPVEGWYSGLKRLLGQYKSPIGNILFDPRSARLIEGATGDTLVIWDAEIGELSQQSRLSALARLQARRIGMEMVFPSGLKTAWQIPDMPQYSGKYDQP